jgi:fatty acid desaturase
MASREQLEKSAMIRDSYRKLPFQRFWTWLTGKEIPDSKAKTVSPIESTAWALIQFAGGITLSVTIQKLHIGWGWLVVSMTLTVSGARYIVATIIHHGVHNAVLRTERANRVLCELLSTAMIVQPFDSYKRFHVHEHHGRDFSTMGDKDLAAIYTLGLKPGVPVERMKWILIWQCLNPCLHARYFLGRVKSNFIDVPLYRVAMSVAWLIVLATAANLLGPAVFLVSIVLPLTVLYQICSLLHLVTEHAWILRAGLETVRDSHIKNSHARFCGRMPPVRGLSTTRWFVSWTIWWAEHLLIHLPARLPIVQGSLIVHDWHHRTGADRCWPNAIQRREEDVRKEIQRGVYTYTDIWGLQNVIVEVMQRISDAPAIETGNRLKYRLN